MEMDIDMVILLNNIDAMREDEAAQKDAASAGTILQQPQGAIHTDTELLKHLIGHLTVTESGDLKWPYSEMVDGIRDAGESSDVVDALVKRKSELYGKGKG